MAVLTLTQPLFHSVGDELAFDAWMSRIKAISRIERISDEIVFHIPRQPSDASLRELLGVFARYSLDLKQLKQFESPKNREWFKKPRTYWHKKMFR